MPELKTSCLVGGADTAEFGFAVTFPLSTECSVHFRLRTSFSHIHIACYCFFLDLNIVAATVTTAIGKITHIDNSGILGDGSGCSVSAVVGSVLAFDESEGVRIGLGEIVELMVCDGLVDVGVAELFVHVTIAVWLSLQSLC